MLAPLVREHIPFKEMEPLLNRVVKHISDSSNVSKIILFGSLARDEFTDGSDIDLALIFPDDESLRAAKKILLGTKSVVDWALDYLFYSKDQFDRRKVIGGAAFIIAGEGKTIYSRAANDAP